VLPFTTRRSAGALDRDRRATAARLELEADRDTMWDLAVDLHSENGLLRCELAPEQYASRFGGDL
jgi:hypothetical protein